MTRYTVDVKPGGGGDFSGLFAALAIVFVPLLLCAGLISLLTGGSSPRGENAPASPRSGQNPQNGLTSLEDRPNSGIAEDNNNFDPPRAYARRQADVKPVQIGIGKWRISFETPGPAMLETGLRIEQGDTYYIKMDKEAKTIQVGWLGEDESGNRVFAPSPAPSEAFVDSVPHKLTMISKGKNAQLAFNVSIVPNGKYEIEITESQFPVRPDEYAPGVPLKKKW